MGAQSSKVEAESRDVMLGMALVQAGGNGTVRCTTSTLLAATAAAASAAEYLSDDCDAFLGFLTAAEGSISVPGIAWKDMAASGDLQDALEDALTFVLSLDGTVPRDSLAELAVGPKGFPSVENRIRGALGRLGAERLAQRPPTRYAQSERVAAGGSLKRARRGKAMGRVSGRKTASEPAMGAQPARGVGEWLPEAILEERAALVCDVLRAARTLAQAPARSETLARSSTLVQANASLEEVPMPPTSPSADPEIAPPPPDAASPGPGSRTLTRVPATVSRRPVSPPREPSLARQPTSPSRPPTSPPQDASAAPAPMSPSRPPMSPARNRGPLTRTSTSVAPPIGGTLARSSTTMGRAATPLGRSATTLGRAVTPMERATTPFAPAPPGVVARTSTTLGRTSTTLARATTSQRADASRPGTSAGPPGDRPGTSARAKRMADGAREFLRLFPEPPAEIEARRLTVIHRHAMHVRNLATPRVIDAMRRAADALSCECFWASVTLHRIEMLVFCSLAPPRKVARVGGWQEVLEVTMMAVPRTLLDSPAAVASGGRVLRRAFGEEPLQGTGLLLGAPSPLLGRALAMNDLHLQVFGARIGWMADAFAPDAAYPDYPPAEQWPAHHLPAADVAFAASTPFLAVNDASAVKRMRDLTSARVSVNARLQASVPVIVDGAPVGSFTVQTFRDDVGTWGQVQWAAMETASAALAQEWRKGDAVAAVNMPRSYVLV